MYFMLLSTASRQKGEAAAARRDDVKDTVERWRLDSSLTICRLCYSTGLRPHHPPIHPPTSLHAAAARTFLTHLAPESFPNAPSPTTLRRNYPQALCSPFLFSFYDPQPPPRPKS